MWVRAGLTAISMALLPRLLFAAGSVTDFPAPSPTLTSPVSLPARLTALSEQFSVPVIYSANTVSNSAFNALSDSEFQRCYDTSQLLQIQLSACLHPLGLVWQNTESGIIIKPAETPANRNAQSGENSIALEEVMVTGHMSTTSPEAYNQHYDNATRYARQIKSEAVGEKAVLVGAMLNRLPAGNLAEALQALPGLSITRDRGEALNINAMGLSAEYQMTLLNGHRLANTENIRNSNQYGQQYRFDTLSAGLFNQVTMFKTAATAQPAGAAGATVDLLSDDPLDYKFNSAQVRLTAASPEAGINYQPGFAAIGNLRNHSGTLGAVFRMNYENRLQRQYQFETWHWGENGGAPEQFQWQGMADNTLVPTDGLALTIENEDRTRATYYANVVWQPVDALRTSFLWLRSDTGFSFDEHRLSVSPVNEQATAVKGQNNSISALHFSRAEMKSTREESTLDYATDTFQASAEWKSDRLPLTVTPFYSQSRADSVTRDPISRVHVAMQPAGVDVDVSNHQLNQFVDDGNTGLVSSYSHITQMSKRRISVENSATEWGGDVAFTPPGEAPLSNIEAGCLHATQAHHYTRRDIQLSESALAALPDLDGRWLMPLPNGFEADFFTYGQAGWLIPKSDLFQLYDIALSFPADGQASVNDLLNSYAVTFSAMEAYVSAVWQPFGAKNNGPNLMIESGMRYTHTESETTGSGFNSGGSVIAQHFARTDSAWLPSVAVKWQFTPFWQWRAGYTRSLNRPNYSDLNPKIHVNSGGLPYAEAGNPLLKPVVADTFTTSVNVNSESIDAELLAFSHHLTDYISEQALTLDYQGTEYETLQRTNNSEGRITGVQAGAEIAFGQSGIQHLRHRLSATITRVTKAQISSQSEGDPTAHWRAEGVSDWTGNIRLLSGWQAWQAAININYRSRFAEQRDLTNNADVYVEDYTGVDLSLNWLFSANATLRMDIYNATNETVKRTVDTGEASALMKIGESGRRFVVSLGLMF